MKVMIAICMWMIVPVLLGSLWSDTGGRMKDSYILRYLLGLVSEWAVFFVLAKWAVARQTALHELGRLWFTVLGLLTLSALVWGIKKHKFSVRDWKKFKPESGLGLLFLAMLIVISIACGEINQNESTVESVLTMYATDTLYQYDAATGHNADEMLSFQREELENKAKAPIESYYAVSSFACRLNPTKYVRILLPVFLLPFYFCVYRVWAEELFGESRTKRAAFQVIVWLLYGSAIVSERAVLFAVFLNCWNGGTLFFAGLLPMAVWLLLGKSNRTRWFMEYVVCVLAGQLLYEKGGFIISLIWGIELLAAGIKRWKNDSSI